MQPGLVASIPVVHLGGDLAGLVVSSTHSASLNGSHDPSSSPRIICRLGIEPQASVGASSANGQTALVLDLGVGSNGKDNCAHAAGALPMRLRAEPVAATPHAHALCRAATLAGVEHALHALSHAEAGFMQTLVHVARSLSRPSTADDSCGDGGACMVRPGERTCHARTLQHGAGGLQVRVSPSYLFDAAAGGALCPALVIELAAVPVPGACLQQINGHVPAATAAALRHPAGAFTVTPPEVAPLPPASCDPHAADTECLRSVEPGKPAARQKVAAAKVPFLRSHAVLDAVPWIATLVELHDAAAAPDGGPIRAPGDGGGDNGAALAAGPGLASALPRAGGVVPGSVLLQNRQSVEWWGRISPTDKAGSKPLLAKLFQEDPEAVPSLLSWLNEQVQLDATAQGRQQQQHHHHHHHHSSREPWKKVVLMSRRPTASDAAAADGSSGGGGSDGNAGGASGRTLDRTRTLDSMGFSITPSNHVMSLLATIDSSPLPDMAAARRERTSLTGTSPPHHDTASLEADVVAGNAGGGARVADMSGAGRRQSDALGSTHVSPQGNGGGGAGVKRGCEAQGAEEEQGGKERSLHGPQAVGAEVKEQQAAHEEAEEGHEEEERWHEVQALLVFDAVTGSKALLLLQTDITARAGLEQRMSILTETQLTLLENMFPRHVLELLMGMGPGGVARQHQEVTIMFCDIVGFTTMSKEVPAQAVMDYLNDLFSKLDRLCDYHSVYKVETAGDCYIVAGALMAADSDGFVTLDPAANPLQGAQSVLQFAQSLLRHARTVRMPHNGEPSCVRVGIHTGSVVSGLIGSKMPKFSLFGDTMNTSSRMESTSKPGCIHISESTYALLGETQRVLFAPTGGVEVKGKGLMSTYLYTPSEADLQLRPKDVDLMRVADELDELDASVTRLMAPGIPPAGPCGGSGFRRPADPQPQHHYSRKPRASTTGQSPPAGQQQKAAAAGAGGGGAARRTGVAAAAPTLAPPAAAERPQPPLPSAVPVPPQPGVQAAATIGPQSPAPALDAPNQHQQQATAMQTHVQQAHAGTSMLAAEPLQLSPRPLPAAAVEANMEHEAVTALRRVHRRSSILLVQQMLHLMRSGVGEGGDNADPAAAGAGGGGGGSRPSSPPPLRSSSLLPSRRPSALDLQDYVEECLMGLVGGSGGGALAGGAARATTTRGEGAKRLRRRTDPNMDPAAAAAVAVAAAAAAAAGAAVAAGVAACDADQRLPKRAKHATLTAAAADPTTAAKLSAATDPCTLAAAPAPA